MKIRRIRPSRTFAATSAGAGLVPNIRCSHGEPILDIRFFNRQPGKTAEDIAVLLPQCVARQLFGAALAYVQTAAGTEAAEQFVADMLAARDEALERIAKREAGAQACCEAGAATGGREHTCRRDTASPA
jgi:hypothetical protein